MFFSLPQKSEGFFMNIPRTPNNLEAFLNLPKARRLQINEILIAQNLPPFSVDPRILLSERQFAVFERLGVGMTTREIAEELYLSKKTIETHRENIKEILGLRNGNQLIVAAALWVASNNYPSEFAENQSSIK